MRTPKVVVARFFFFRDRSIAISFKRNQSDRFEGGRRGTANLFGPTFHDWPHFFFTFLRLKVADCCCFAFGLRNGPSGSTSIVENYFLYVNKKHQSRETHFGGLSRLWRHSACPPKVKSNAKHRHCRHLRLLTMIVHVH